MGINLNGTSGGIVLNGTRDPGLEKAIADLELNKVDKENGKGLSANDYTDDDKAEVAKIKDKQDKLVFDDYPKVYSTNPVTSHGLYIMEDDLNQGIARNRGLIDELQNTKADKPILSSDTKSIKIDTNSGNKVDVPTIKGVYDDISGKQDKTKTTSKTDVNVSFDLKDKNNCFDTYVSSGATNVSISISDGEYPLDYTSSLSFKTANTAPQTSYTANSNTLMWVGSECTVSGSSSVFAPISNKIYDIVFYFNGINFVGLVNGYDNIPQQGA